MEIKTEKDFRLPLDDIEVMEDELTFVLGGAAMAGGGAGCGCGCKCGSGDGCGCGCTCGNGSGCGCGCSSDGNTPDGQTPAE